MISVGTRHEGRLGGLGGVAVLLGVLGVISAAGAAEADAQVVLGRLLESSTRAPIPIGTVALVDPDGNAVHEVLTDLDGSFRLEAPQPGAYYVRAQRIGYHPRVDGVLELGDGGRISIDFYLKVAPLPLDSITASVTSERIRGKLQAVGFYERRARGLGYFLSPDDIHAHPAADAVDFVRSVPGVQIREVWPDRALYFVGGLDGSCTPRLFLDGVEADDHTPNRDGLLLDQMVHADDVEAMEIYPHASSMPTQYTGTSIRCGALLIWTISTDLKRRGR